jgi:tetratricopeptide (TPR) repeat protein
MTEEFQQGEEHSEDTMFQDAVAALRKGDKPRAKELLTLLLNADQNNPTYWVWLSAAVDNSKERVYCLQTALKLDPVNNTAKRGLILLGALAPDDTIQPFTVNRPRAWENKLLLANEKPREKGFKAIMKSPALRLAGIGALVVGLMAVVYVGFLIPRQTVFVPTKVVTVGPTSTFTTTPTVFGAVGQPTKLSLGPTPLWMLLKETYTPTPAYVNTPHGGASGAYYRAAQAAYQKRDWDTYLTNMQYVATYEPEAADIHYYIGEAYRFKGEGREAIREYNEALKIDDQFGPAYLGLALARLLEEPGADVEAIFKEAIKRDPDFGDAYLELARYHLSRKDTKAALADLGKAVKLMPSSADVYIAYAKVYVALDDKKKALEAAEKAYAVDVTSLPVYQLLGELYIESGQYQRATEALDVYVIYEPEDAESLAFLGRAYYEMKDYKKAVENFDKAFAINRNSLRKFYLYRGIANLELENIDQAAADLEQAGGLDAKSFDVNFGLARVYFLQEKFGSAFQRIEPAMAFAKTDEQKALAFYWRAMIQEKRDLRNEAVKDWQALLAMDDSVVTAEMRKTAEERLRAMVTATPTPKGGKKTATPTATLKPRTPTPTAKGGATVTPTSKINVTATPTPQPNVTASPTSKVTITPPPPTVTMTPPPKVTVTGTATPTPKK